MYYDRKGEEIDVMRFGNLCEDYQYRKVKEDIIGKYIVSTRWLGIDHSCSYLKKSPPVIFESIIFCEDMKAPLYREMKRYATEQVALDGHNELCKICPTPASNIISSDEHIARATKEIKNKKVKK